MAVTSSEPSCGNTPFSGTESGVVYELPDNVLACILGYLPGKSVGRACCVCKQWARVGYRDQEVWQEVFRQDFGGCGLKRAELTWRQQYKVEWGWRSKGKPASRVFPHTRVPEGQDVPEVMCLDFNKKILVMGDNTGVIHIWDMGTREHRGAVRLGKHQTIARCVHLQERVVVSGCDDGSVRVWDTESLKCTHMFRGHEGPVVSVQFGPGVIVSGSEDQTILLWDLQATSSVKARSIQGFPKSVEFLQVYGQRIVGGTIESVCMWDMESGSQIKMIGLVEDGGYVNKVLFDGFKVAIGVCGHNFQCIEVWNVEGMNCEQIHSIYVSSLACFTLDGMRIIGQKTASNKICMWDLQSGKRIKTLGEQEGSSVLLAIYKKKIVTSSTHRVMELREWGLGSRSKESDPPDETEGGTSAGCFSSGRLAKISRQSARLVRVFQNIIYMDGNNPCLGN